MFIPNQQPESAAYTEVTSTDSAQPILRWHNYAALAILGFGGLIQISDTIDALELVFSSNLPSLFGLGESLRNLAGELAAYRAYSILLTVFLATVGIYTIRLANKHVQEPHQRGYIANWATWGIFMLGAGPIVAFYRLSQLGFGIIPIKSEPMDPSKGTEREGFRNEDDV